MSIFLSPGVFSQEIDLSDIVQRVATAPAALVGYSVKGDTANIQLITSDQQFIDEYGEPDPSSGSYFHYTALAYLKQGNTLYTLRVENGALFGGLNIMATTSSESNAVQSTGASVTTFSAPSGLATDVVFQIFGKDPGAWNNKVGVIIQNSKDGSDPVPTDQYTFEILVYAQDDDGNWVLVETWKVSRKQKIDGYGRQLYLTDRINGVSSYIHVSDSALADTVLPKEQSSRLTITAGDNGSTITDADIILGWDEFNNPDTVDVRILINGGNTSVAVQTKMRDVAESRLDCMAVLDMPFASTSSVSAMLTFRNTTQNFNSSYCALYSLWPEIHDPYNDVILRVPPSGYVAGQYAYNDQVGNVWTAPAGANRGIIDDALSLTLSTGAVLSEGERDVLNPVGINVMQSFRGRGNMIFGQRTQQSKLSALSFVNVRRLLIVLEKSMVISLQSFVFEPNNELTRFRVEALLNSYLDDLSSQGAFQTEANDQGFHVVCDATNNTPTVIDNSELRVDVFVKPSRAIEFIRLRTIVTDSGVSFDELRERGGLL